jgi:predicted DNA-binding protein (MmcQ/YjbR family)
MFALIPLDNVETQISLKCDPERAINLREEYSSIVPAWHFNKKHWNTVLINHTISHDFLCELICHSYNLVVSALPKKLREELAL